MSLGKHTVANLVGNALPMAVALVSIPLFLGYIGAARYGVLSVVWALLGYFSFFDLGLGRALSQRMSQLRDHPAETRSALLWTALAATIGLGVVGSAVLWLFSHFVLPRVLELPPASRAELEAAIDWLLLSFPFLLLTSVLQGALQARLRFMELNLVQVAGSTASHLVPLALAASGWIELSALIPAVLLSKLSVVGLMFWQCRRFVPLIGRPRMERTHLNPLLRSGGWFSAIGLVGPLLVTVDRVVIAALSGPRSVAQYVVPYDLVSRLMVISASLSSAIFPRLAAVEPERGSEIARQATAVLVAAMTPAVIVGLFIVHPFMIKWVGGDFAQRSFPVAEIILIGVWINALVIPSNARLLASGRARSVVQTYLIQLPLYLALLYVGVTEWGVLGAAVAWSLRVVLDTLMLLHLSGSLSDTLRTSAASASLVAVAALIALTIPIHSPFRWLMAFAVLALSFAKDRHLLVTALGALRSSRKGVAG